MADIFIRPYDEQRKSPARFIRTALLVLAVTAVVVGGWIWLDSRPEKTPQEKSSQKTEVPPAKPQSPAAKTPQAPAVRAPDPVKPLPSSPAASSGAQQLFTRAQSLAAAGNLAQARDLLGQVIASTADESLKNNALRVQGRIHMQLFLSDAPMAEKKSYVIQPGDSLDRIARQNKTTVELIRRINGIEGSLIYPGRSLLLPAAPFVVEVSKSGRTLDLTMNGRLFKRYSVGLGVEGKTPTGRFKTVVHQINPDWTPPGGGIIPFGDPRNELGTRWISFQDSERPEIRGFGIHGTTQRDSIGGETSNGCVRMVNEEVEELYLLIPRGTDIIISE